MIARARAARFRIPPLKSLGSLCRCSSRSTDSSVSSTAALIFCRSFQPASTRGKATFSSTVRLSNTAPSWKSSPIFRRCGPSCRSFNPVISTPSTMMLPLLARISPITSFKKTLLPVPLPPIIATPDPRGISSVIPFRICCWPICLCRSLTRMKTGSEGLSGRAAMGGRQGTWDQCAKSGPPARRSSRPSSGKKSPPESKGK